MAKQKSLNASEIRDWVTIFAVLVSLGGIGFNLISKPVSVDYRISAIENKVNDLKERVDGRLSGIEKNLDRIWNRIK